MKIGILTSSRADYGIYMPLLKKLSTDNRFDLEIIAFGMHLQESQGLTIKAIEQDGFGSIRKIPGMPADDSREAIAIGYGELVKNFARFWNEQQYNVVFALGDRWEMSAAVQASLPFEITLAHLHGGETTLGAIDEIYRHQITLASTYHFTAAEPFSQRVKEIIGHSGHVYTVGSISLEDLQSTILPEWQMVKAHFDIPFDDFILVTIHPESVNADKNCNLADTACLALESIIGYSNLLITKANSDVMGSLFNHKFRELELRFPQKVKLVSSLGRINYFKAMQQSSFLLGNTSSGIVEAASFSKWVINIGDRQKGRLRNENVLDVPFELNAIELAVKSVKERQPYMGGNKYMKAKTTDTIIEILAAHEKL